MNEIELAYCKKHLDERHYKQLYNYVLINAIQKNTIKKLNYIIKETNKKIKTWFIDMNIKLIKLWLKPVY